MRSEFTTPLLEIALQYFEHAGGQLNVFLAYLAVPGKGGQSVFGLDEGRCRELDCKLH